MIKIELLLSKNLTDIVFGKVLGHVARTAMTYILIKYVQERFLPKFVDMISEAKKLRKKCF